MSYWTYINGTITVTPMGRTQAEKRYILETVLEYLPKVTGSERDMSWHIIQKNGYNEYCNCEDIFDRPKDVKMQSDYIIVIEGALRDTMIEQTTKEFYKWLIRLSKRIYVDNVLVKIDGWNKEKIISLNGYKDKLDDLLEYPSWCYEDNKYLKYISNDIPHNNWCEQLINFNNYD